MGFDSATWNAAAVGKIFSSKATQESQTQQANAKKSGTRNPTQKSERKRSGRVRVECGASALGKSNRQPRCGLLNSIR
jgi:hypothetical protein